MKDPKFGRLPSAGVWKLRLGEECARTQRYHRPFAVLGRPLPL